MIKDLIIPDKNTVKFVFFSGKGGVGKSTMSCAAAVWLAKAGYRTLLVTTDPAPNLADIFGQGIGHQVTPIRNLENLHAIEIDPDKASEEYRERIVAPLRELLDEKNMNVVREQLKSPCVEEVAAFDKFIEFMDDPGYDVVVFDTAPTGHTLRLLELPTDWKGFIDLGTLTKQTSEATQNKYADVIEKMRNPDKSAFVFVMYPEYTPIVEAWRASEDMKKQVGIETALVAVNYLLPPDAGNNAFFDKRRKQQEKYLAEISQRFNKPMLFAPLRDHEPKGLETLRQLGQDMCGEN